MRDSSMTDILYDYFASRILFGYYVLGDTLPSASYICKHFQVSALTVRAAFARLREEGFIKTTERKLATVVYHPDEQVEQQYLQSFFARKEGMEDICRNAGLLFGPMAQVFFRQQDDISLKRIRSQLKKMQGHPAKQITLFYSEAMHPLNNALALNLYWEVVRYLRTPYLRRPVNFDDTDVQAAKHIERMLALIETRRSGQASEEMLSFSRNVTQSFWGRLPTAPDAGRQVEPCPFEWQIYRDHPQLCYTLAAKIIDRIDRGIYVLDELLPSCQALAQEYGVSLITMRRTLELLCDMRVTETHNGIGTKVVAGKNVGTPDFSHSQIRKSLILFLQALQIGALTCKSIAVHTLSFLDDTGLQALGRNIQRHTEKHKAFLIGEICLQFIGKNSPSAFIREVYRQLYQLLLWGHCLHVFFQRSGSVCYYEGCAAKLQESLRKRDIQGFADLLSKLINEGVRISKDYLLELGFEECKLI